MSALLLPALAAGSSGQGAQYVDDVFSAYLRAGTGADTTVTTGIDMTKGYMLWSKGRSGATEHAVYDSARGVTLDLVTNSTAAQTTQATGLKAVSSTGHTIGSLAKMNTSGATYVDWVFRKAPKFFDVVTYTGNGVAGRQIAHSLGVAPGMVILKAAGIISDWYVYHRALGATQKIWLNSTSAANPSFTEWNSTTPTNTSLYVGANTNDNGTQYVAYLFAHDPSAEGIIQCGSVANNGTINLEWEPQFVLTKNTGATGDWYINDSMRGMGTDYWPNALKPNSAAAEVSGGGTVKITAAGFTYSENNGTAIYLAIRRPNKPPTTGTQVYSSSTASGVVSAGFPVDLHIGATRTGAANNHAMHTRLTGGTRELVTSATATEATITDIGFDSMTGLKASLPSGMVNHFFRRAPGFMDVVCYAGNSASGRQVFHNLTAVPELIIIKARNDPGSNNPWWSVLFSFGDTLCKYAYLNTAGASGTNGYTLRVKPTQTYFGVNPDYAENSSGTNYVAYLFVSLLGISKVGSYTGNGTSQTIDCGFSAGARFFLVKATSTTGSWWVYDSARGIVSAADPALQLNSSAAEITSADAVDPASVGIIVNQEATCSINATGVSYIFLAIA